MGSITNDQALDILKQAMRTIEERAKQYDTPEGENSFGNIAKLWEAKTGVSFQPSDAAEMLGLTKVGRAQNPGFNMDNYVDACAYFAFAGALRLREVALAKQEDIIIKEGVQK